MDVITAARAEKIARALTDASWIYNPDQMLVAAAQDDFGRWYLPGVYDVGAISGEDDNGTLWRLLAGLHNINPGIELTEALHMARAIMGQQEERVMAIAEEVDSDEKDDPIQHYTQARGLIRNLAHTVLYLVEMLKHNDLNTIGRTRVVLAKKHAERVLGEWQ